MYEPRAVRQEDQSVSDSDSEFKDSSDDSSIGNVDEWILCLDLCECGCCMHMPTVHERKCSRSTNIVDGKAEAECVPCIILHEGFQVNCSNIHELETTYYEFIYNNGPREEHQDIHE
ncbi:uncharacterized protein LOC132740338 [Ruditapes philippinarum]|uniref:uncharacterized protein LOC132740338 n=1 Tax=Ruditapes philippinarum TaxID=129788 RepID=UPI00295BE6B3|nr:uncharacterized protein LOC132740338 [Ruditapes philippinarum]